MLDQPSLIAAIVVMAIFGITACRGWYVCAVDLQAMRSDRNAWMRRCLTRDRIRYFEGKDGPWTTLDLVNAAGGLRAGGAANDLEPYDPDGLVKAA